MKKPKHLIKFMESQGYLYDLTSDKFYKKGETPPDTKDIIDKLFGVLKK